MKTKKIVAIVVALVIVLGIALACWYFMQRKDEDLTDKYLKDGYTIMTISGDSISTDLKSLSLKKGDIVNIYLQGEEVDKELQKQPFIKNAVVSYDYENSDGGIGFFATNDMNSTINCSKSLAKGTGYTIVIERSTSGKHEKIEMNNDIKKFLGEQCVPVEAE